MILALIFLLLTTITKEQTPFMCSQFISEFAEICIITSENRVFLIQQNQIHMICNILCKLQIVIGRILQIQSYLTTMLVV